MNNREYYEDWGLPEETQPKKDVSKEPIKNNIVDKKYLDEWGLPESNQTNQTNKPSDIGDLKNKKIMDILTGTIGLTNKPLGKLTSDIFSLGQDIKSTVGKGVPSLLNQVLGQRENQKHLEKNIALGLGGIPINIVNTLFNTPSYLTNLEPNLLGNLIKEHTPQLSKEKFYGAYEKEKPTEEDINVRRLMELYPIGVPIGKTATSAGINAITSIPKKVIGKSNPIAEAQKVKNELLLGTKESELENVKEKLVPQTESHEEAQAAAKREGIATDHEKLVNQLNVHDEKINQANVKSEELQQSLDKITQEKPVEPTKYEEKNIVPPEKKELVEPEKPIKHEQEHENAVQNFELSENNLNKAKEHHEEIKNISSESNKNIGNYLESGATHDVRTARLLKSDLESSKKEGTKLYNKFENEIADQGILINNSTHLKSLNDDLFNLIKAGKMESKEANKLLDEIAEVNNQQVIPATRYVSMIKAVNGYMRDAFKKAYEPGINEDKRVHYLEQGHLAEIQLEKMNKTLEENIGKENFNKLKEANDYWKTNIVPLYKEPLYWKILNQERMSSSNMASELRGGPPGSGLDIIKNVLKRNPQAVKHVVGQRYDSGQSIHDPNELIKEYTDLLPDLKRLSDQQVNSELLLQNSKNQIQEATKQRDNAKRKSVHAYNKAVNARKEYNEKLKEHKSSIKEQTSAEKAYQKELSDYEKIKTKYHKDLETYGKQSKSHTENVKNAEKEISDHEKEIKKLQEQKEKINEHMKNLKEKFNAKKISLKEKDKLGREISKLKKESKKLDDDIDKSTTGFRFLFRSIKILYKTAKRIKRGF